MEQTNNPARVFTIQPSAGELLGGRTVPTGRVAGSAFRQTALPTQLTEAEALQARQKGLVDKVSALVAEREAIRTRLPQIEEELREIRGRGDRYTALVSTVENMFRPIQRQQPPPRRQREPAKEKETAQTLNPEELEDAGDKVLAEAQRQLLKRQRETAAPAGETAEGEKEAKKSRSQKRREKLMAKFSALAPANPGLISSAAAAAADQGSPEGQASEGHSSEEH